MNILELTAIALIAKEKCTAKELTAKLAKKGLKKGVNYPNVRRILENLVKKKVAEIKWEEGKKVYSSTREKLKEILAILEI